MRYLYLRQWLYVLHHNTSPLFLKDRVTEMFDPLVTLHRLPKLDKAEHRNSSLVSAISGSGPTARGFTCHLPEDSHRKPLQKQSSQLNRRS